MIFCKNIKNIKCYDSVGKIPTVIWQQLNCTENLYFHPDYLSALAKHNHNIKYTYIILFNNKKEAVALAIIQLVELHFDSIKNNMQTIIKKIKYVGNKLGIISLKKPFTILMCGNSFVSGEHGVFIKNEENKTEYLQKLVKSMTKYVNTSKELKNNIDAYLFKDFKKESINTTIGLHNCHFSAFNAEPNMQMNLDSDWECFDDYLTAMRTKFRVKAKKALKQSNDLSVEIITTKNIDLFLPKMKELYKKVVSKASFNLGEFNIDTYKSLKENLGNNYLIQIYCLNNKVVGFLSGMFNNKSLDAHFVGIDYKLNHEYAIYQRILYDYIKEGIEKKVTTINFGRTASEIKSSIGAVPEDLTIFFRHKQSISNQIAKLFLKKISPTPFRQKFPFKDKKLIQKNIN